MSLDCFIINCATDTDRWAAASDAAMRIGARVQRIEAIDARAGLDDLKPFGDLLPEVFWKADQIKPGAFACFLSHRKAWQAILDQGLDHALICEDDAVLEDLGAMLPVDLAFVNDRMSALGTSRPEVAAASLMSGEALRAVGGDGYVLSQEGARKLLAASAQDKVICGVDWYLFYCTLDSRDWTHKQVKGNRELKMIWQMLGGRAPLLSAGITLDPWVRMNPDFASSIRHSVKMPIADLRD